MAEMKTQSLWRFMILSLVLIAVGCTKLSDSPSGVFRLPYVSSCEETINQVRKDFSQDQPGGNRYEIEVLYFDVLQAHDLNAKGLIELRVYGNTKLLNGEEPSYYLKTTATSIKAACMLNREIVQDVSNSTVEEVQHFHQYYVDKYGTTTISRLNNNNAIVYFNDGKYSYPQY